MYVLYAAFLFWPSTFGGYLTSLLNMLNGNEPVHEISNNVVCATRKDSDQPAHTRILIRAFACRSSII